MRSLALAAVALLALAAPVGAQCTTGTCQTSVTVAQTYGLYPSAPQFYGGFYGGFYAPAPAPAFGVFGPAPAFGAYAPAFGQSQYRYRSNVRMQSGGFFRR